MTITVQRKDDPKIQITYNNCELTCKNEYQTEYQGISNDESYTIVVDNYSLPEDRRGTVYESRYNEEKEEWEEYDFFWFYQDKMIVE